MAVDNTHIKYLHGADKKAWNNYAEAMKAQAKLDNFFDGFKLPNLKKGEVYEPTKKRDNNKNKIK